MKRWVLADFETASTCDLKAAGAWRYAEDPTTEILCLGFTEMGEKHEVWIPGASTSRLVHLASDPEVIWIAHNAQFEKAIWRTILTPVYGVPDVPDDRWHDTMAVCAEKVLPLKLDEAARVLELMSQKDNAGSRLTIGLSKPRKDGSYDRSPETLLKVYEYCATDLAAEVDLHRHLGWLEPNERSVWLMDQTINQRGIRIDRAYIQAAAKIVEGAAAPAGKAFRELTGLKYTQRDKVLKWVREQGVDIPDLKKETIDELLDIGDDRDLAGEGGNFFIPSVVREALTIRASFGSASVKKLPRMAATVCGDGRARGLLQYHGAGPGRWAGRLFQPHNFPRGALEDIDAGFNEYGRPLTKKWPVKAIVDAIMTGDHEWVSATVGDPIDTVVTGLRHALVAEKGYEFHSGDFSGIEAKVVLSLAGQHDKTAIWTNGGDPYCDMASAIYNEPVTKAQLEKRQIGKNSVLGLGFQMGAQKFYDRYCSDQPFEFAERVVSTYRKEWAPLVPKVWYALEAAAAGAVWNGRPCQAYGVEYKLERNGEWLSARLPSGRKLWYYQPHKEQKASFFRAGEVDAAWSYCAKKNGVWRRIHVFGGLLTENVVQGLARDLLVDSMFKCEAAGLPIVLTVHDEIVVEVPGGSDVTLLKDIMLDPPGWAREMKVPIQVDTWTGERYRK